MTYKTNISPAFLCRSNSYMALSSYESPGLDKTFSADSDLFMELDHLFEPNNGIQPFDEADRCQPITYVACSDVIASTVVRISFAVGAVQPKFPGNFIESDEVLGENTQFSNGTQLLIQGAHQECSLSTIPDNLHLLWDSPPHQATQPVTFRWQNLLNDAQFSDDNGDPIHSGKQRYTNCSSAWLVINKLLERGNRGNRDTRYGIDLVEPGVQDVNAVENKGKRYSSWILQ